MDIYAVLKHLEKKGKKEYNRAQYFKWKFGLYYKNEKNINRSSEVDFLRTLKGNITTFDSLKNWELSGEYNALVKIYMGSKVVDHTNEIYQKIYEQAKEGDIPSAKFHRELAKQIEKESNELIETFMANIEEESDEE